MNDRGVRPGINAVLKRHPKTGALLRPVGFVSGKAVWPILGASPDDDSNSGGDNGDGGSGSGDGGGGSGSSDSGGSSGGSGSSDGGDSGAGSEETVSKAEHDAVMRRLQAADKRASEFETELKKLRDRDKGELEKAQDDLKEAQSKISTLTEEVGTLRLKNAFLSANKTTWHNSETALSVAKSKGLLDNLVSDDGEVDGKGLASALDKLAKEEPYLVKKADEGDEGGSPSGEPAGGRSKNNKDDEAARQARQKRFPALR